MHIYNLVAAIMHHCLQNVCGIPWLVPSFMKHHAYRGNLLAKISLCPQVLGPWVPATGQPAAPLNRPQETLQDLPEVLEAAAGQQQQQQRTVHIIDRPSAGQVRVVMG